MFFLFSHLLKYLTKLDVHNDNNSIVIDSGMQICLGYTFNFDMNTIRVIQLYVYGYLS